MVHKIVPSLRKKRHEECLAYGLDVTASSCVRYLGTAITKTPS